MSETRLRPDGFRERGDRVTRLETFVDAAFAFAVSMLVISVGEVPETIAELKEALKLIPAFAASFALIMLFWRGHDEWSRRYGIDDAYSSNLSVLLVFLVLIFVYPLRMIFSGFFAWISGGFFPSEVRLISLSDVRWYFGSFAVAMAGMGMIMLLLTRHAARQAHVLALTPIERIITSASLWAWTAVVLVSCLSLLVCLLLPSGISPIFAAVPGLVYFLLNIVQWWLKYWVNQQRRRIGAEQRHSN